MYSSNRNAKFYANCAAVSFTTTSDNTIKDEQTLMSSEDALNMLDNIEPMTYKRNDLNDNKTRVGFIANQVESACPDNWQTIVYKHEPKEGEE